MAAAAAIAFALGACGKGEQPAERTSAVTAATVGITECAGAVASPCAPSAGVGTGILRTTRYASAPLVVRTTVEGIGSTYTIYARLTRALPKDPEGGTNAWFDIGSGSAGHQGNPVLGQGGRRPHCYEQAVNDVPWADVPTRSGAVVRLVLHAHDGRHRPGTLVRAVSLIARHITRAQAARDPFPTRVGC